MHSAFFASAISKLAQQSHERCASPKCSSNVSELKSCAACCIASYCSKECQNSDWKRHKTFCLKCRPFKQHASTLMPEQKKLLDDYYELQLPPILDEYRSKYPADQPHHIWIAGGLQATQDMVSTSLHNLHGSEKSTEDFLRRWQQISPNLKQFLKTAELGDVYKEKHYVPYKPKAPQHFRNTPLPCPYKLDYGRTVIDIGFVDFGISLDSIDTLGNNYNGEPLRILGFDAEQQCVAKTLIMVEMMKDQSVSARSIVEVWLSSLWSKTTLQQFKKAAQRLLKVDEFAEPLHPRVEAVIKFWKETPKISRKAALDHQLQAVLSKESAKFVQVPCGFEEKSDRVGYLRYYFTKALYEDSTTTVSLGVKQIFENCFEAAPLYIHMCTNPGYCPGQTFISRTKCFFEEKIQKYMDHVRRGSLVFTPKLGMISYKNKELVREIAKENPYTISWSNVVDYIKPSHFHSIARKISGPDTVHYLHSCNWTTKVYGTDIFDVDEIGRLHIYTTGLILMERSNGMYEGIKRLTHFHFRDLCTSILGRQYIREYFKYFFQNESVHCACFNGDTPLQPINLLARNVSTAHFQFAYAETGISFGIDSYDF